MKIFGFCFEIEAVVACAVSARSVWGINFSVNFKVKKTKFVASCYIHFQLLHRLHNYFYATTFREFSILLRKPYPQLCVTSRPFLIVNFDFASRIINIDF